MVKTTNQYIYIHSWLMLVGQMQVKRNCRRQPEVTFVNESMPNKKYFVLESIMSVLLASVFQNISGLPQEMEEQRLSLALENSLGVMGCCR